MSNNLQTEPTTETVETVLRELVDWCREHTGPTMPNSPHDILVRACAVLEKAKANDTCVHWCEGYAVLYNADRTKELQTFSVNNSKPVIDRIEAYLAKHGLRCTQIRDGRIYL